MAQRTLSRNRQQTQSIRPPLLWVAVASRSHQVKLHDPDALGVASPADKSADTTHRGDERSSIDAIRALNTNNNASAVRDMTQSTDRSPVRPLGGTAEDRNRVWDSSGI